MSRPRVLVIGAGMGGLAAALRLARHGFLVRVLEARSEPGGLASGFEADGFQFDGGPYVLLDRPGLEWAFRTLGHELQDHLDLRRIDEVYEVASPESPPVRIVASLRETAAGLEHRWAGSGRRYEQFVRSTAEAYRRLSPLLHVSRPGLLALARQGAWTSVPLLMRSLRSVLERAELPPPVVDALAIWTHVAGQRLEQAPSVLAFVPALIHEVGAFYPRGGLAAVPRALARLAEAAGVELEYRTPVRAIHCRHGRVIDVETEGGRRVAAEAVVSNAGGVGTYLNLTDGTPRRASKELARLPLQSPGVCAYVLASGEPSPPYLRFWLPGAGRLCRLWIRPALLDPELRVPGPENRWPARLMSPMDHAEAEGLGRQGQSTRLDGLLGETWWRQGLTEWQVVARRVPADWGAEFRLHRDSMNPVMTSHLMRAGRLAHRSPWVRGLYLAGSATHPGQWVSFCAISGILAADRVREDVG